MHPHHSELFWPYWGEFFVWIYFRELKKIILCDDLFLRIWSFQNLCELIFENSVFLKLLSVHLYRFFFFFLKSEERRKEEEKLNFARIFVNQQLTTQTYLVKRIKVFNNLK